MGKKYKKKVQWRQLSLKELQPTSGAKVGEECEEEEEGEGGSLSPTHDSGCPFPRPYPRHPHHPHQPHQPFPPPHHFPRRGAHHHAGGGYYRNNFDKRFDRRSGFENIRNLENRGPYKPVFYDRNYQYDNNKYSGRPPFCSERGGYKFGYTERGRRPFRPYGRPVFFHKGFPGHPFPNGQRNAEGEEYFEQEDEEEEWDEMAAAEEQQHLQNGCDGDDKPSQPVHTVMINNEEYTKIQTPRQEVIFKKSSLDRRQDSLDQYSMTGSTTSASGSSSTTGVPGGNGDQMGGDQESMSGSLEDNTASMTGDEPPDHGGGHEHMFEDPNELFVNESGGPPLAGVVMQQAYPGGPMYTIPVHWTPFIDPNFIPGETALTPLDPAFTHVIDPKTLPIDPVHILPVQHDAAGCPVQVQVKVDSNGVPIQIEPSAFTVSLSSLPQHQHQRERDPAAAETQETAPPCHHQQEGREATPSEEAVMEGDEEEEEEEKEEEEEDEEMVEGEKDETQDTLNEGGEMLGDKEDKLEDKAETKDTEEEKEREEKEEKDEVTVSETQDRHRQSTSADPSDQSSSCDADGKVVIAETVEEIKEGVREEEKERNEECGEGNSQEVEERDPPVPTNKTHEVEGRKVQDEEEEEEEEDEEEEDMLTKESEEGSDSSDSQYASMSESSSTPTTPSGELTDPHETPTATHAIPATSTATHAHATPATSSSDPVKHPQTTETDSHDSQQETPAVSSVDEDSNDTEAPGDSQTDGQTAEEEGEEGPEATPKISQGYVMVPILTPYYDPSVLYGYPVVVPTQQQQVIVPGQHHQQPSPPPHHHPNYNKKKKKKYQRRRQVDPGSYLDPQLYTGEPFVATPGGYVVPLEAAASVCHIHGIQYVTPAFHQRLPDEGFVSLQHSPYLPDVAAEPPTAEAQSPDGTNSQSDGARTVFSDLQDTERQQIQEILQEHNKVSKSDSTESSDSGVSESEEAAAAEASSDELESRQDASSTQTAPESEDSPDSATDTATSASQCQEDSPTTPEVEETQHLSIQHNTVTAELCTASVQADVELCVLKESQACQTEESISEDQTPCEEVVLLPVNLSESSNEEVTCSENDTEGASESITADTESRDHQTEEQPASPNSVAQGKDDGITTEECNDITVLTEANETDDSSEPEIPSECGASEEPSTDTSVRDSEIHILAQETEETLISNTSVIDIAVDNQNTVSPPEINSESCDELTESPSNECISSSNIIEENVPCKSEGVSLEEENFKADEDFGSEVNDNEIITLSKESYEERDNNISVGRIKELKVTEAVTRWIREVTPEKAFTLSEEIQSRLLADQESIGEMDTEDEYIEDEMATETKPTTVLEPKNVKGNPFVAPSSESPVMGVDGCSKRVALMNKFRGTTPDTIDDYDGSSTISNLSVGNLHSEASSCLASVNQSFDEDVDKYAGNPEMYDPSAYAKYYQLGIEVDEITPTATPPLVGEDFHGATPSGLINSETVSECGSEDIDSVPHEYEMTPEYTETSPLSLATEILKAEKVITNMVHITGDRESLAVAEKTYGNPDLYLKHYNAISRNEVSDSGVQSEDSSDETEGRSIVSSSGVGSSLASTPAVSPAHHLMGRPPLQPYPLKNLSVGEGPVPCKTVCCAVM